MQGIGEGPQAPTEEEVDRETNGCHTARTARPHRSAGSIKKITKAQELIATSRIARAQARVEAARPYNREITNMLTELASCQRARPSTVGRAGIAQARRRAGGVVGPRTVRGLQRQHLPALRRAFSAAPFEGKNPILYVVGRKALNYYSFRNWKVTEAWTGFSERPDYANAQEIASTLVEAFLAGADDEGDDPGPDGILGG